MQGAIQDQVRLSEREHQQHMKQQQDKWVWCFCVSWNSKRIPAVSLKKQITYKYSSAYS